MNSDDETEFYEEDSAERSGEDILALNFLQGFIMKLVVAFSKYRYSSKTLMGLARALYISENFGKVTFDGSLSISSGTRYDGGGSVCYEVEILSDQIIFSLSGSEYTEGVGHDSVFREFYSVGQSDAPYNLSEILEGWEENFNAFVDDDGDGLSVSDMVENFEGSDEDN